MKNDSLTNLGKRLSKLPTAENGEITVFSDDWEKHCNHADGTSRAQLKELEAQFGELIPNDFNYTLHFDRNGVELDLEFEDGNAAGSIGGASFTSKKSMFRFLRKTDWDEGRLRVIKQGDAFEEMTAMAETVAPNIPSSEKASQFFENQLSSIRDTAVEVSIENGFCLLTASIHEGGDIKQLDSLKDVYWWIAEKMTLQSHILAVYENGNPWSFEKLEKVKRESIKDFGPISKAKAERRFPMEYDNIA